MSDRPSHNLSGLHIDLARRIDEVCRRFEAVWREGRQPRVEDFLVDVSQEGRPALQAELEALERELRQSGETVARPEAGPPTASEPQTAPNPCTIAEASTIAPGPQPTTSILGEACSSVHEQATVRPSNPPRSPYDQPTAAVLGQHPSATPGASEPNRIRYFGDYEITRELARGGMGVVFQARQVSLNRVVALKMILAGQLANDTDVKRFYTEAEAAANLDHPGIVPVFEVGQHEGQHYFSMGFVEGQSLSQRLAEGPLPAREAAELIRRVSQAIEYAHQRGVIHRDLKPANILLDQERNPRVTDFGLAKKIQGDSGLTGSGQIMGTPSYMPPEQAGGKRGEVGPAADVYALGATLYALVTGRPPFQAATATDTVLQVLNDDPVPPSGLNPSVPADLETICLKCLEKEPSRRYASAAALGEDLRRYPDGEPIRARRAGAVERARKWARRRPVIAGLLALLVMVTVLGVAGVAWQWSKTRAALAEARTNLYSQLIGSADREITANNGVRAEELLEGCPPENRGWEWNYLKRRNRAERITLAGQLGSFVGRIAYTPDGRFIVAVAEMGNVLSVWDAATGATAYPKDARPSPAFVLDGRSPGIISFASSPDGRRLAVSRETGLEIHETATGITIRDLSPGNTYKVRVGSYSQDGRTIAGIIGEGRAGVVDAETGKILRTRDLKPNLSQSIFAADGKHLAQFSNDRKGPIYIFDLNNDAIPVALSGLTEYVGGVAFDRQGRALVSAAVTGAFVVWDTANGRVLHKHSSGPITAFALSQDGSTLATAAYENITLRGATTGELIRTFRGHKRRVDSMAFSPDGSQVVSLDREGVAKVWDVSAEMFVRILKTDDPQIGSLSFSPDGRSLATVEYRAVTREEMEVSVRIWDVASAREIRSFRGYSEEVISNAAYHPDGKHVALSMGPARDDHHVHIWDLSTGQWSLSIPDHGESMGALMVYAVAFHPSGDRLATTGDEGFLTVWDIPTGRQRFHVKAHEGIITDVAFSQDGRWIATAGHGGTALWDASTGREVLRVRGSDDWINAVDFAPDGRGLAAASSDRTVSVWDTTTGKQVFSLHGHKDVVSDVAYSPEGRRIVSAGSDRMVKIWDASTGREILSLKEAGHHFAFSPDGQILAAVDQGVVRLWDGRPWTEPARRTSTPKE
jgi:eukaryotic-like serine/threonine-protein kinase